MCKVTCKKCDGEGYILGGCCNGFECGCRGQPVSLTNCKACNPDASAPLSAYMAEYADYVEYVGVTP